MNHLCMRAVLGFLLVASATYANGQQFKPLHLLHDGLEVVISVPWAHPDDPLPQGKPRVSDGIAELGSYELEGGNMLLLDVGIMHMPDGENSAVGLCNWISRRLNLTRGDPTKPGHFSMEEIQRGGSPFGVLLVHQGVVNFSGAPIPALNLIFVRVYDDHALLLSFVDLDEKNPMKLLPGLKKVSAGVIDSLLITRSSAK